LPIVICLRETAHLDLQLDRMRHFLPRVCAVLVPHNQDAFELPPELKGKSRFVGTIARPRTREARPVREKHDLEIAIRGGGHPDTAWFFNLVLQAIVSMRNSDMHPAARLIAGPLFKDWLALKPVPEVVIVPFDPALVTTMDSADLVVCQGGYNTVAELEQMTVKAIIVPGQRRWDDQFARAASLAKENARIKVFSGSAGSELAEIMIAFLGQPITVTQPVQQQGARRAAEYLLELLQGLL
jgi:predicted glycosyltransferase